MKIPSAHIEFRNDRRRSACQNSRSESVVLQLIAPVEAGYSSPPQETVPVAFVVEALLRSNSPPTPRDQTPPPIWSGGAPGPPPPPTKAVLCERNAKFELATAPAKLLATAVPNPAIGASLPSVIVGDTTQFCANAPVGAQNANPAAKPTSRVPARRRTPTDPGISPAAPQRKTPIFTNVLWNIADHPDPSSRIVDQQFVEGNKNLPQRVKDPLSERTMWRSGNTPLPQL